ncbi:flagellar basal-body MS-ring/collar protein FliF [Terriglobus tenax]|uniref:flagellar basal-body MS-ring/collar protein FliF n=1 Tax=Terriglobus tenax TaxID=1111115 RepID=UPI0021E0D1EB|nr:flagellar basal-body MS-ring/collar protein FliF [Terriglobus tenax]
MAEGSAPWQRLASNAGSRWNGMPKAQRSRWMMLAAMAIAAVAAISWYGSRTEWKTLFSGLDPKDVQVVSQELTAAGINAKISSDGGEVMVPDDLLDKARMEVASKGMPQSGRMGFEIFDKPNWVGSEFDEKVNFQRALEGELEHTIGTLGAVRSARVHLALARQGLFSGEDRPAKATVVLKLRRSTLDRGEVESIRNLVAGAVENLQPEQVTLVDADGHMNLGAPSQTAQQSDLARQMEQQLVAMLEPVAGRENVHATVHADYEQGSEEKTDEVYDPALSATVSMQRTEQVQGSQRAAAGVPGTQSNAAGGQQVNTPPSNTSASQQTNVPPLMQNSNVPVYPQGASGTSNNARQESASYAVTRHLSHSEEGPGRLKRLTVAVLVNDRPQTEGSGKTMHSVWHPRSGEEMRRLEQLAQAATGFDAKRGDQLVLENISFESNGHDVPVTPMQRVTEQAQDIVRMPGFLRTAGLVVLGMLLVMFVLRPMVKQTADLIHAPQQAALAAPGQVAAATLSGTEPAALLTEGSMDTPMLSSQQAEQKGEEHAIFEQVKKNIRQEPKQSTRLLEHWMGVDMDE